MSTSKVKGRGDDSSTYYVKRKGADTFEVSRFGDGAAPEKVYNVVFRANGTGKCDCPNYQMRKAGVSDKHIRLVARWVDTGEKIQAINNLEEFIDGD